MSAIVPGEGYQLGGRYRLDAVIGEGGMGTVWAARDELLDRPVAIKELRFSAQMTEAQRAELTTQAMSEARNASQLHHPRIVTTHDVVMDAGRPWIVMQLVDGRSLHQDVAADGPWPPERVAHLAEWLLEALEAAHAAGVIHRDVKPSNVLIPKTGGALLTDFSIAKAIGTGTMTSTGVLMGSPGYIAPERVIGARVGVQSDLFGLGATLFFALEGYGPFDHPDPVAGLFAAATQPHPRPEHAGELTELIDALLEKNPADRATINQAWELLPASRSPGGARTRPVVEPPSGPATGPAVAQLAGHGEKQPAIGQEKPLPATVEDVAAVVGGDRDLDTAKLGPFKRNRGRTAVLGGVGTLLVVLVSAVIIQLTRFNLAGLDSASNTPGPFSPSPSPSTVATNPVIEIPDPDTEVHRAPREPDFAISSVKCTAGPHGATAEEVSMYVTIKTTDYSGDIRVSFVGSGDTYAHVSPGTSTVKWGWWGEMGTPPSGSDFVMTVTLDSDHKVAETNEGNNSTKLHYHSSNVRPTSVIDVPCWPM